jgi:putative transposase
MNTYKRHRFPPDIISYAVWLYHRFNLSNRDVEDLLAERGLSYSTSNEKISAQDMKFEIVVGAVSNRD